MGHAMHWGVAAVLGAMVMPVFLTLSLTLFGWHQGRGCRDVMVDGARSGQVAVQR